MPVYNRLTDRQQVSAVTLNDIIHVVVTGDTSQSPQGSSYFAPLSDIQAILSGSTGPSGTNGTSGSSGTSGTNGANGTNGTSGANGTNGTSGANGTNGTSGANGTNGTSGANGTNGTSGTSGANGTSGTSGANGTSGTSGTNGSNGSNGTSGNSGSNGSNGTSGTSGTNGASGTNGTSGSSIVVPGSNNEILTSNGAGGIVAENLATFNGTTLSLNKNSTSPNIALTDSGSTLNDVYIRFSPTATTASYAVGIDKDDGNAFKITYGSNVTPSITGNTRLEITSGGTVRLPLTSNSGTLFLGSTDQFQFYPTTTSSSFEMYNGSSNMDQYTQVSQFNGFFSLFTNIGNENSSALTYILNSGLSGQTVFGSQAGIPEMILFNSGSTSNPTVGGSGLFVRYNLNVDGQVRVGTVSGSGAAVYRNAGTGILSVTSSDERLKQNITPIQNSLDIITNLRGVYFNWKDNEDFNSGDETRQIGMIAQEVEEFLPEAVTLNGNKDYKTIRYSEMVGLLIEGIKEQNTLIQNLQSEIELIKQKLPNP